MGQGVFLSTYEKQLDGKRRLLIPQEFRTADNGAEHGVFCFFSIESDCLEAGGDKLMAEYVSMIEELPFGDDVRTAQRSAAPRHVGRPRPRCEQTACCPRPFRANKGKRWVPPGNSTRRRSEPQMNAA